MPSQQSEQFFQDTLYDIKVRVEQLIADHIRREVFFDRPWTPAKNPSKTGKKLLYQSGDMQDGYMTQVEGDSIKITNTVPYAGVHNEGAEIPVTAQMKKYFWAMYYKASGAVAKTSTGRTSNNKRNRDLNAEAQYWKSLALMKIGSKIKIPARPVIGDHPQLNTAIEKIVTGNLKESLEGIMSQLNPNS